MGEEMTTTETDFQGLATPQPSSSAAMVESSRATAEVQGAIVAAKRFPRDQNAAYKRIMEACKRKGLAKSASYAYPRGGTLVTGPSIRLAEVMAMAWGNLKFGVREISQKDGQSEIEAFCWDLETNVSVCKTFAVVHERYTNAGVKTLKDPRDIYEIVANNGARRLRAAILAIIPPDIVEEALLSCHRTLSGAGNGPIADRIRKMVSAFDDKFQVSQEAIERRLRHGVKEVNEDELIELTQIYNTMKDGEVKREAYFKLDQSTTGDAADLNERFGDKGKDPKESK